jgi:hypothetical protein
VNGVRWCRILQLLATILNALSWYLCGQKADKSKDDK